MRQHVDRRNFHDGGKPHGRTHVVGEIKERTAECSQLRNRHAIQRRAHGVLPNTEVQIASGVAAGLEVAGTVELQGCLVRSCQVGRAAD